MRPFLVLLFSCLVVSAGLREDALDLIGKASQVLETRPAEAAEFATQAYQTLSLLEAPAPGDLSACAAFVARAHRDADDRAASITWFQKALSHAEPASPADLRAELADLLMRDGRLQAARQALGTTPDPPAPLWHQTSAKIHLTSGQPELAQSDIAKAIAALPSEDAANRAALHIDAAGIALRLDEPPQSHLELAETELLKLEPPHPDFISALASVAAQAPHLSPGQALSLLQGAQEQLAQNPSWEHSPARLSFAVTLADAASKARRPELVKNTLAPVLAPDALPADHPLRARAFFLAASATNDRALALESSATALRWLANSQENSSEILLGIQRTVDPISPLLIPPIDPLALREAALVSQNSALRKRLSGLSEAPQGQSIHFLIYQRENQSHYGALILKPAPVWIDLGPAEKIHQRLTATIESAERTLGEATGSSLSFTARLTQLWKSVWEPLVPELDQKKPLTIVPTGHLHFVPWATLRNREGRYLCQLHHEVRILALSGSFTSLPPGKNDLHLGIPEAPGSFDTSTAPFPFDPSLADLISKLSPLPGVRKELARLSKTPLFNTSESKFRTLLKKDPPGRLHLAGHGFIMDGEGADGFRAGLLLGDSRTTLARIFSGTPVPPEEDNILFAHEIADLDLSTTELVVLSVCRGGIGRSEVGGNWSSLRRAFIAAGARQVLASQWRVRDDELPAFMEALYRKIDQGTPAPQALWHLQRAWLEEDLPASKGKSDSLRAASAGAWVLEGILK